MIALYPAFLFTCTYTCVITCILQFREGPVMIIIYYFSKEKKLEKVLNFVYIFFDIIAGKKHKLTRLGL